MTRAEEAFKAWLRSPERVFVPKLKERYAQGRALGLSRGAVKAVLAAEPELTQGQTAFRLRFWHEAEVDLGFLHWNSVGHGTFFLGKLRRRGCRRVLPLPALSQGFIVVNQQSRHFQYFSGIGPLTALCLLFLFGTPPAGACFGGAPSPPSCGRRRTVANAADAKRSQWQCSEAFAVAVLRSVRSGSALAAVLAVSALGAHSLFF
jgi:hypothetical protein